MWHVQFMSQLYDWRRLKTDYSTRVGRILAYTQHEEQALDTNTKYTLCLQWVTFIQVLHSDKCLSIISWNLVFRVNISRCEWRKRDFHVLWHIQPGRKASSHRKQKYGNGPVFILKIENKHISYSSTYMYKSILKNETMLSACFTKQYKTFIIQQS